MTKNKKTNNKIQFYLYFKSFGLFPTLELAHGQH